MERTQYLITRASLNLTRACNLACSYCFTNGCTKGSMSLEIAKKIVDFLFNNAKDSPEQIVDISFWGGEPLIEWELLKNITLYVEDVSKRTAIPVTFGGTTNGTLLTPDKLDWLDEHKVFFMVSIDGTKESHDTHRKFHDGYGSHDIVMKNMESVLKKWPFYRARLSPSVERIDHFYEDMKYLFDFGFDNIMFSPVYEGDWTDQKWATWEEQSIKVVDYMVDLKKQGRKPVVEHFKSYVSVDNSKWPCGAGRNYCGFDIDGAIYPCHRFNKFNDNRPWQEKEVCIGHVDHGITRPDFRQTFIDLHYPQCGECERLEDTPCHGGCFGVNFDFNGRIDAPHKGMCKYVEVQKKVSMYFNDVMPKEVSCMPYSGPDMTCECFNANYTGPIRELKQITPQQVMDLLRDLQKRVEVLELKKKESEV